MIGFRIYVMNGVITFAALESSLTTKQLAC